MCYQLSYPDLDDSYTFIYFILQDNCIFSIGNQEDSLPCNEYCTSSSENIFCRIIKNPLLGPGPVSCNNRFFGKAQHEGASILEMLDLDREM